MHCVILDTMHFRGDEQSSSCNGDEHKNNLPSSAIKTIRFSMKQSRSLVKLNALRSGLMLGCFDETLVEGLNSSSRFQAQ